MGGEPGDEGHPVGTPARRRLAPWLAAGIVVVVLVGAAAWVVTRPRECPAVGCTSTTRFDLASLDPEVRAAAATAEVCLEGACSFEVITAGQPTLVANHDGPTLQSASVVIEDREGVELQRLELTHEVEGQEVRRFDDCIPACWAIILVDRDGALDAR